MKSTILIFILSATLLSISCKKLTEVDTPRRSLVTESVFQNDETATAALFGIYSSMVSKEQMFYLLSFYTALNADELKPYSNSVGTLSNYTNTLIPLDAPTNTIWNAGFYYIYQTNAIIEGSTNSLAMTEQVKKQIIAEGHFIRAFWHFYLVNFFGEIPVVTSTSSSENAKASRQDVNQVYQQIISDLKIAQTNLNDNYVGNNSVAITTERTRPNKGAATALLARAYLYNSNYSDAELQATSVIANISSYDTVSLNKVFLKNSKEAIWQLMMPSPANNRNTYEGTNFILTQKPVPTIVNSNVIQQQLYDSFENGDKRKTTWIGKFVDASVTPNVSYFYPFKYQVNNSATISEYSTLLRLGELYLIRAEARAQMNNLSGAIDDIDVIRKRAGLSLLRQTNPSISKADLITAILNERRFELFTEYGHRWLDLKRTHRIDAVMAAFAPIKGTTWSAYKQLFPIPQSDLNNNPNLAQNTGY